MTAAELNPIGIGGGRRGAFGIGLRHRSCDRLARITHEHRHLVDGKVCDPMRSVGVIRKILVGLTPVLLALSLTACGVLGDAARPEFRSLSIIHGRFDQSKIKAPAGKLIKIDITLMGLQDVSVSIPDLGIGATTVPANSFAPYSIKGTKAGNVRRTRFVLGPLKPGEYQIVCDCPGQTDIAYLVVE